MSGDEYWMEVYDAANILVHEESVSADEIGGQVAYYLQDFDRVEITRM